MTLRNKLNALTIEEKIEIYNMFAEQAPVGDCCYPIYKMADFEKVIEEFKISPVWLVDLLKRGHHFDLDDEYFYLFDHSLKSFNKNEAADFGANTETLLDLFEDEYTFGHIIEKLMNERNLY